MVTILSGNGQVKNAPAGSFSLTAITAQDLGIIQSLAEATHMASPQKTTTHNASELFSELRTLSRDPSFLKAFDSDALDQVVSIFTSLDSTEVQPKTDTAAVLANVLCVNVPLRQKESTATRLRDVIPVLYDMFDLVHEHKITSETQYNQVFPIFRLFFFLAHIPSLVDELHLSALKISAKLLNFITMSTQDSQSLNAIIIEILKILYTLVHQVGNTEGLDSSYVLSCNKFNLSYAKQTQTCTQYDEILVHFSNVLLVINPEYSRNYMLNKISFTRNLVCLITKQLEQGTYTTTRTSPVPALLALDLLMSIDNKESGIEQLIASNLDMKRLNQLAQSGSIQDPHLPVVLAGLNEKISSTTLEEKLSSATDYKASTEAAIPRFEDLSEREQDEEIAKMKELLEKIEKNGVFKLQMK
ncbi:CYFA0S10e02630g1_1 [Cyberlindnera fabianii]|uniref:CYFA0S10e02630g1_1 n=1 Tax=Cyberlindnera fabianii TaxID=36022 RepID=A0A061B560_CYBFA|nr:hypothetical protein BON22_3147 [Cyberlindnera fabianii]CDR42816.1 CYFA0S10e02630g1_1 [Cyberlindnera fabianii]